MPPPPPPPPPRKIAMVDKSERMSYEVEQGRGCSPEGRRCSSTCQEGESASVSATCRPADGRAHAGLLGTGNAQPFRRNADSRRAFQAAATAALINDCLKLPG